MARLFLLLVALQTVLAVTALIGCLSAEKGQIKSLPRIVWVLVILFVPVIGPLAWFSAGRGGGPGRAGKPGGILPGRPPSRPAAPDDDPEFLKSLDDRSRQQDQELFRQWEDDLRRREDDLRRREDDPPRKEDQPEV